MRREYPGRRIEMRAEVTTPELAVHAVRAGMGIALVAMGPRLADSLEGLRAVPPPPGLPPFELSILAKPDRYLPRYMEQFLEHATEALKAEMPR
jgi:DNA-binding transcriptional LysR family regulator